LEIIIKREMQNKLFVKVAFRSTWEKNILDSFENKIAKLPICKRGKVHILKKQALLYNGTRLRVEYNFINPN